MRVLLQTLLVVLFLGGTVLCVACGWGILQAALGRPVVLPDWIAIIPEGELLLRGSYWGMLAVAISAVSLAFVAQRPSNRRRKKSRVERLVAIPMPTLDLLDGFPASDAS